ncbi:MAG: hypothetical protein JJU45_10565 [Acidimicrobiia bacterium]|nr:hypothetical protein [Acidimicrobiia bacterium]
MTIYERLLDVQDVDTTIEQVEHQRSVLPLRAEHAEVARRHGELSTRRGEIAAERDALRRSQQRLEDEVEQLESKRAREEKAMNSGAVTNPRELQGLQAEVESLARRQRELEDEELEIMEALEPLDADVARLDGELASLATELERLEVAVADADAALAAQLEELRSERSSRSGSLPADVLADYEKLRAQLGGIAIARLADGTCGGCHLRLSAVEIDRIRHLPLDERVTCEECGRLLVR